MSENAYIRKFLENLEHRKYSLQSISLYRGALKSFFLFLDAKHPVSVQDITLDDLERYRFELVSGDLSLNTVNVYLRAVKLFFSYLEKEGVVFSNPASALKVPRPEYLIQPVPSITEMKKLLASADGSASYSVRDRAVMELLYSCGLRLGELTGLKISSLDLSAGMARIYGKGRRERAVPITKKAVSWIKRYIQEVRPDSLKANPDEEALFLNRGGTGLSGTAVQLLIKEHAARAGIETPLTPHAIRRACATHMLQNGANPVYIRMLLGHADMKTLGQYLKVTVTDLSKTHKKTKVGK